MLVDLSFSVILHILFIFVALSILFVFVISKTEKNAFSNEIGQRLTPKVSEALATADTDGHYKVYIRDNLATAMQLRDAYSNESKPTTVNNKYLKILMVVIAVFLVLCAVLPILYLNYAADYKVPFGIILLENIILFVLVGGFEILFFLKFARNYVPVLPSKFINRVYARLQ